MIVIVALLPFLKQSRVEVGVVFHVSRIMKKGEVVNPSLQSLRHDERLDIVTVDTGEVVECSIVHLDFFTAFHGNLDGIGI